jgi:uncharacterized protein (DUF1330 family)
MAISPTPEQLRELGDHPDQDSPIVMLNLLKFRDRAQEGEGSGQEAYGRYGAGVAPLLQKAGGRLVWAGRADHSLIGETGEHWDMVALVEYPSRRAFVEMATSAAYQEVNRDRVSGLERMVLVACTPAPVPGQGS